MTVLDAGTREFRLPDPDGDYLCYETGYIMRGPSSLLREVARQRKRDLWLGAKFTYFDSALLAGAGCVSKIDVGFAGYGRSLYKAVESGQVKTIEWTNNAITMRLLAGAMGLPFIAARYLAGTDCFRNSGAKLIEDPFTGQPVCVLPALNPDVSLIHVHQCDVYGNARIFGAAISPLELAMASRKVIVSTEEIVDTEEIRRNPGLTTIPYNLVDAVVEAPFGAHPGNVPGLYASDTEHIVALITLADADRFGACIDKYVDTVESHQEYLEKRVGLERLLQLKQHEVIKEELTLLRTLIDPNGQTIGVGQWVTVATEEPQLPSATS